MPTLAELRCQVRHRLMAMAHLERPEQVPEQVLRGQCVLLATLVMDPSGALTRAPSTDPTCVAQSDQILAHAVQDFAEELMRLEEACQQLQAAAQARGLRGAAADAWCVARVHTACIGHARRRRGTRVIRPHGHLGRPEPCQARERAIDVESEARRSPP